MKHNFDFFNSKIVDKERNLEKRINLEIIEIKKKKTTLELRLLGRIKAPLITRLENILSANRLQCERIADFARLGFGVGEA